MLTQFDDSIGLTLNNNNNDDDDSIVELYKKVNNK